LRIGFSLSSSSSALSVSQNSPFDLPFKLTGSVLGVFPLPGSGSLADLRLLRLAVSFPATSNNYFEGGLMADFRRGLGSFTSVTQGFSSSNLLVISFNSLAGVLLTAGASFAAGFDRATALPFDGLGDIGLSRAVVFKASTLTLFGVDALLLLAAVRFGVAFGVRTWLVEANGIG
jgi:hypothetical protein